MSASGGRVGTVLLPSDEVALASVAVDETRFQQCMKLITTFQQHGRRGSESTVTGKASQPFRFCGKRVHKVVLEAHTIH